MHHIVVFISILSSLVASYEIGSLTIDQLFIFTGNTGDKAGYSVNAAGDVNGDGYDDIIIGAPYHNSNTGAAYVIYGGSSVSDIDLLTESLDPSSTGFYVYGAATGNYFGFAVSTAGDINNDGLKRFFLKVEFRISHLWDVPYEKGSAWSSNRGAAYVIYGKKTEDLSNIDLSAGALDPTSTGFTITGSTSTDRLGYSVGTAKNFNEDGYDDIIVGSYARSSYAGAAFIIYGKATASLANIALATQTLDPATTGIQITGGPTYQLGFHVDFAGDVNNDGYCDVVIGANRRNSYQGAAYIIYGKPSASLANYNLATTALDPANTGFEIIGNSGAGYFGKFAKGAGDVNRDGYADIIIGAYKELTAATGTVEAGVAYIVYGKATADLANLDISSTSLDPQSTGFTITGSTFYYHIGYSVAGGDIDNDGYDDIIIASDIANSMTGYGFVIYGKESSELVNIDLSTDTLNPKTTGFSIDGETAGDHVGFSLSSAGDFNGDGKDEVLYGASGLLSSRGGAYLVYPSKICIDNCDECRYPTRCKTCTLGYELLDDYTCSKCPEATYPVVNACEDCSEGCKECTSASVCQVCYAGFTLLDSLYCLPQNYSTAQANASAAGLESTSLFSSLLTPGSSLPVNFGLVAKLIRNTKYLDIHVSNKLQVERFAWKTSSGFLSAPSSWSSKSVSKTLPEVFSQYGMEPIFLVNYWKPLIMSLIGLGIFMIFKPFEIAAGKKEKKSSWHTTARFLNITGSNFALTQFYSNLDDALFFLVLDARSTTFDTGFRTVSFILAVVIIVLVVIVLGLHVVFLKKYQNSKRIKVQPVQGSSQFDLFLYKYQNVTLLFRDYKDDYLSQQTFLFLHVTRALLSSLVTTTLFEYPLLQTSLLTTFSIFIIVFLIMKRPFKSLESLCGQYFCEILVIIANISMLVMGIYDQKSMSKDDSIESLSETIIIINMILFYGGMVFMVFGTLKMLYFIWKNRGAKGSKIVGTNASIQNKNILHARRLETGKMNHIIERNDVKNPPSYIMDQNSKFDSSQISTFRANLNQLAPLSNAAAGFNTKFLHFEPSQQHYGNNLNPLNTFHHIQPQSTHSHHTTTNFDSTNLDDSLNTSNTNLLSNSPMRMPTYGGGGNKPKPIMRRKIMMPGSYKMRPQNSTTVDQGGEEKRIRIEGNSDVQIQRNNTRHVSFENSALCTKQLTAKEYEDFLRKKAEQMIQNKNQQNAKF